MAFDISNLSLIAHGAGRKVYQYTTTADTLATIKASGYFGQDSTTGQQAAAMLAANDLILTQGTDGFQALRVDTVSGNTVTTEVGYGETQWVGQNINTLSTSGGLYFAAPFDGVVGRIKLVTNGEIDTTTVVTAKIGGTAITGGTLTLDQSGQGAGEVYQATCTAGNAVTEGQAVQVTWDGAVSGALQATENDCYVMLEFVPV